MMKIQDVISSEAIDHYKNLRNELKDFKRVKIGSFVLTFKHEIEADIVIFTDFDHHDNIYEKKRSR